MKHKTYTPEDMAFIRKHYASRGAKWVARKLVRTPKSIMQKASMSRIPGPNSVRAPRPQLHASPLSLLTPSEIRASLPREEDTSTYIILDPRDHEAEAPGCIGSHYIVRAVLNGAKGLRDYLAPQQIKKASLIVKRVTVTTSITISEE